MPQSYLNHNDIGTYYAGYNVILSREGRTRLRFTTNQAAIENLEDTQESFKEVSDLVKKQHEVAVEVKNLQGSAQNYPIDTNAVFRKNKASPGTKTGGGRAKINVSGDAMYAGMPTAKPTTRTTTTKKNDSKKPQFSFPRNRYG